MEQGAKRITRKWVSEFSVDDFMEEVQEAPVVEEAPRVIVINTPHTPQANVTVSILESERLEVVEAHVERSQTPWIILLISLIGLFIALRSSRIL